MTIEFISQLSEAVCWKISSALDNFEKPNWKTLISKMPRNTYDEKAINQFYMAILQPYGSPTSLLLTDLGKKKKKVADLIKWLRDIGSFQELIDIIQNNGASLCNMSPVIERQPAATVQCAVGECAYLHVEVSGNTSSIEFQWFFEGNIMPNEVNKEMRIVHAKQSHSGFYTCRIANEFGYVFTSWSRIEIIERSDRPVQPLQPQFSDMIDLNSFISPPVITMHPRSVLLCTGDTLTLTADVAGRPEPKLQWFYDDKLIPNQCNLVLTIPNINPDLHDGFYTLRATNEFGSVCSLAAQVIINKARPTHAARGPTRIPSTATMSTMTISDGPSDKIALLIGNQDYKALDTLGTLVHPVNDTLDIAATLMSIDFKVVSLINLDLTAMQEALDFFYSIISPGSYALFYFAGHGFEIDGKNYLMPVDATSAYEPSENLPLSNVLFAVTQKRAKLSVLLVDSCRTEPDKCYKNPMQSLMTHLSTMPHECGVERKNVVVGFGCCSRGRVLESPSMRNGYFAKFLTDYLARNIKVEDILYEVSKCINQERIIDPATGRLQIVYRQSTVVDDFKLIDTILADAQESEYTLAWEKAHIAPKPQENLFSHEKLKIDLNFSAECSNCLLIQAKVTKLKDVEYHLDIIMPQRIGGANVDIVKDQYEKFGKVVRISNLEKLQGDIEINMVVQIDGGQKSAFYTIKEKPLYAKVVEAFRELSQMQSL